MSPRQKAIAAWERGRVAPAVPALLAAMTIRGTSYVATKVALPHVGPFTILLVRLLIGTALLLPFAWRQGYRPSLSFRKKFILFGLTGMTLHLGFEILGLRFTSASGGVLIIASAPAVTAAFAVLFLKEKLTWRQGAGIALSIVGVIFITGARPPDGYPLAWLGSLLIFAGVATWGIYTVQGRRMANDDMPWLVWTTAATGAAIYLSLPLAIGEMAIQGPPTFDWPALAAVLYLGIFAQAVAYALWNLALRDVGGAVAGAYVNLVPVIGVGLGLAIGETLSATQVLGGVTVGVGVWLSHNGHRTSARSRDAQVVAFATESD